jgi:hypothetical protein
MKRSDETPLQNQQSGLVKAPPKRPLWKCPKCGHRFVTPNLWHSCGRYSISAHFKGKPPNLRGAFDQLVELARKYGRVTVYAQKSRIVIQARVRFANIIVRKGWLDLSLWLKERREHPRLARIEDYGSLGFGHHFRLMHAADVDTELAQLVEQAYLVGQQEHIYGSAHPGNVMDRRGIPGSE